MNPQVLTTTTDASSASSVSRQPACSSRAASSSESTSLRAQPSVIRLTLRPLTLRPAARASSCDDTLDDTPADYGKAARASAPATSAMGHLARHVPAGPDGQGLALETGRFRLAVHRQRHRARV